MNKDYVLHYPGGELTLHRTRIMGILNVTPDSFSDGGKHFAVEDALERAWGIVEEGADILDIGAQSSRPGAEMLSPAEEIQRIEKILHTLSQENFPLPISLDTYHPEVLTYCLDQKWVQIANDIMGLRNPQMVQVVNQYQIPVIAMHMFETPQTMQENFHYENIIEDLVSYFEDLLKIRGENIVIDPGIGFGKSVDHNLEIIAKLDRFQSLEVPILLGASRKSFMGKCLGLEVAERLEPSLAIATWAVQKGVHILRVHDVASTQKTVRMVEKILPFSQNGYVQGIGT